MFGGAASCVASAQAMSFVTGVNREHADGRRRLGPPTQTTFADAKARQVNKIREIRAALIAAGLRALDEQARSLGLSRSTTWAILSGSHKASGISAGIVIRMLSAPDLPLLVRRKILEYAREKSDGMYGHTAKRRHAFVSRMFSVFGAQTQQRD